MRTIFRKSLKFFIRKPSKTLDKSTQSPDSNSQWKQIIFWCRNWRRPFLVALFVINNKNIDMTNFFLLKTTKMKSIILLKNLKIYILTNHNKIFFNWFQTKSLCFMLSPYKIPEDLYFFFFEILCMSVWIDF